MDLSVIIVNYNVRHFLEQCLRSVLKASELLSAEVIVVDNNSADGSCSMVAGTFPGIFLIRNKTNAGFSAACNQAIRLARGRYILLLNPDTIVEEDTFTSCLSFMDKHPEAGALGARMINGEGSFLPESKRSLPTPLTAFYRMAGLSWIFPRSPVFNRYYAAHIDSDQTSEVEILTGAFMFIRKEALDKTGLLDESYFMYGEDIDLSYRFILAGYKNYYFPEVTIIHYKGESTKKGDLNYLVHFYRAMQIFTDRYFGDKGYGTLRLLIHLAVYFRGFIAFIRNCFNRFFLPIADALVIIFVFSLLIPLWAQFRFGTGYEYPGIFESFLIPGYTILTIAGTAITGGYRIPSGLPETLKGVFAGSAVALIIYALLPSDLRFSRAVPVIGSVTGLILIAAQRLLLAQFFPRLASNPFAGKKKILIAANSVNYGKITRILSSDKKSGEVKGRLGVTQDDLGNEVLGSPEQLREVLRINHIDEIIFSTEEMSASQIIAAMREISDLRIRIFLAQPGGELISASSYLGK